MSNQPTDAHAAALQSLVEVAAVKGRLDAIMQLLASNHGAIQQRITDLQVSTGQRFDGLDERINTLEKNERSTAMKAAGLATLAGSLGGLVGAGLAVLRLTKGA